MKQIDILHTTMLAGLLLNMPTDDTEALDQQLAKIYGIDLDDFHKLSCSLMQFCMVSTASHEPVQQGFAHINKDENQFAWIMNKPMYDDSLQEKVE